MVFYNPEIRLTFKVLERRKKVSGDTRPVKAAPLNIIFKNG